MNRKRHLAVGFCALWVKTRVFFARPKDSQPSYKPADAYLLC